MEDIQTNQKPEIKKGSARKGKAALFVGLGLASFVVVGIWAIVLRSRGFATLKSQLADVQNQLSDQKNLFADQDKKIERLENLTLKLKKQGYVEKDEFSNLASRILRAVVLVTSTKESITLSPTGEITSSKEFDPEGSSGSGFFVRSDGLIATAKHVVETIGRDSLIVLLQDGRKFNAKFVNADEKADVALIKIDGHSYPALELGYYDNLQTGDEVGLAGFAPSARITKPLIHRGVVSAKGNDQQNAKLFTINTFINRGNSGGPVFSAKTGRVVGIIAARQRDKTSEDIITLPPGYAPAVSFGGTDPVRLSIELYNKTLRIVGDVSQVGIGIAYPSDVLTNLLAK